MTSRLRSNGLLIAGLIGTLFAGGMLTASMVELLMGDPGHHWTHEDMRLPLGEADHALELYVGDERLRAESDQGRRLGVRLNNWQARRAELALRAVPEAFLTGISVTLLFLGLRGLSSRRRQASRISGEGVQSNAR
jgi:hypothetical protein